MYGIENKTNKLSIKGDNNEKPTEHQEGLTLEEPINIIKNIHTDRVNFNGLLISKNIDDTKIINQCFKTRDHMFYALKKLKESIQPSLLLYQEVIEYIEFYSECLEKLIGIIINYPGGIKNIKDKRPKFSWKSLFNDNVYISENINMERFEINFLLAFIYYVCGIEHINKNKRINIKKAIGYLLKSSEIFSFCDRLLYESIDTHINETLPEMDHNLCRGLSMMCLAIAEGYDLYEGNKFNTKKKNNEQINNEIIIGRHKLLSNLYNKVYDHFSSTGLNNDIDFWLYFNEHMFLYHELEAYTSFYDMIFTQEFKETRKNDVDRSKLEEMLKHNIKIIYGELKYGSKFDLFDNYIYVKKKKKLNIDIDLTLTQNIQQKISKYDIDIFTDIKECMKFNLNVH